MRSDTFFCRTECASMERFMLLEQTTATRRELSYRREDILNLLAFTFYPIMHNHDISYSVSVFVSGLSLYRRLGIGTRFYCCFSLLSLSCVHCWLLLLQAPVAAADEPTPSLWRLATASGQGGDREKGDSPSTCTDFLKMGISVHITLYVCINLTLKNQSCAR